MNSPHASLFLAIIFRHLSDAGLCNDPFFVVILWCFSSIVLLYVFNWTIELSWAIFLHGQLSNCLILGWVGTKTDISYSAILLMSTNLH